MKRVHLTISYFLAVYSDSATNMKSIGDEKNGEDQHRKRKMSLEVILDADQTAIEDPFNFVAVHRRKTKKQIIAKRVSAPHLSPFQLSSNQPVIPKNKKQKFPPIIGYNSKVPQLLRVLKERD